MIDDHVLKSLPVKGQRAQATPVSTMTLLPQLPGGKKQPNRSHLQKPKPSLLPHSPFRPNSGRVEGRPHENPCGGHPPSPPNGHAPQMERGVTKEEAQGVRLPKKQRRRAVGSEAKKEGRSLKVVSYSTHYKGASSKRLPTAPQPNPYNCHKSRQQNTLYPYTSHMLGADP